MVINEIKYYKLALLANKLSVVKYQSTFTCAFPLSSVDMNTFIVYTCRHGIGCISLDIPELVSVPLSVYNLSAAAGLDWDLPTNSLFWADTLIYVANLNVSYNTVLLRCMHVY